MPTVTATEFNQRPSQVKALSEREPVFVTERGRTTTVVLSIADFNRLRNARPDRSLGDVLVADDDVELDIVRDRSLGRVPDLGCQAGEIRHALPAGSWRLASEVPS